MRIFFSKYIVLKLLFSTNYEHNVNIFTHANYMYSYCKGGRRWF